MDFGWLFKFDYTIFSILVALVVVVLYYYNKYLHSFWERHNIPYIKPNWPFLGNEFDLLISHKGYQRLQLERYLMFPNQPFIGMYNLGTPSILATSAEFVHQIIVKDFSYFPNRPLFGPSTEVLLNKSIINLQDSEWKHLRHKLAPIFTPSKLKGMIELMEENMDILLTMLKKYEDGQPVNVWKLSLQYGMDVICSCVFGYNPYSQKGHEDSALKILAEKNSKASPFIRVVVLIFNSFPWLEKIYRLKFLSKEQHATFVNLLDDVLDKRVRDNTQRIDLLHLLNELKLKDMELLKKGELKEDDFVFNDEAMLSNAFTFFSAGYETSSGTLAFSLLMLALHKDAQEKVYEEILEARRAHDGKMSMDFLKDLLYMDQVIFETLRVHPPIITVRRKATKDYPIPGTNAVLKKGWQIVIPIHSIHYDPRYFPEPEVFNPDRFSPENRKYIQPGSYIPFGGGPRICIGERFASMSIKLALSLLLLKYEVVPNNKTTLPVKYDKNNLFLTPLNGMWLSFVPREQS